MYSLNICLKKKVRHVPKVKKVQLVLDIRLRHDATFKNFLAGSNAPLLAALQHVCQAQGENNYYYWGAKGCGLSHLLQAACHAASKNNLQSMYVPLAELKVFGPDMLEGVEGLDLICLDDLQLVAGDAEWEEAVFHAFNRIKDAGKCLILGSHLAPSEMPVKLKDLYSRLHLGACFQIKELDDHDKVLLLQQNAGRRGFKLSKEIANYLINHYPRDMATQLDILQKLDLASLVEQHKITLPFVKSTLKTL